MTLLLVVAALLLDQLLAEPKRWHPLVGFGRLADSIEHLLNRGGYRYLKGLLALLLVVAPLAWLAHWLSQQFGLIVDLLLLYLAVGAKSLVQHLKQVIMVLQQGTLEQARTQVGMIVSRDASGMDRTAVIRAALESLLENGLDALFGALFWFVVAGPVGVVVYRLVNTLDAMWGYRTERFQQFGWAAARFDDLLNWVPARLTAFSYALMGNYCCARRCWRQQSAELTSPNGGVVMTAGAGSLGITLGGDAVYHGERVAKPLFGAGRAPEVGDLYRAQDLFHKSLLLWLAVMGVGGIFLV